MKVNSQHANINLLIFVTGQFCKWMSFETKANGSMQELQTGDLQDIYKIM